MKKYVYLLSFILIIFLAVGLISASDFGINDANLPQLTREEKVVTFNNNTANVNASEYWITTEGTMDDVSDLYTTLDSRYSRGGIDLWNSTFNITFDSRLNFFGLINNASYLSTFNSTYAGWNKSYADTLYTNQTYVDAQSTSPAGLNTYIQYNDGGVFGGHSDFSYIEQGEGGYFKFNDTAGTDYINCGSGATLDNLTSFTISAWAKPLDYGGNNVIASKWVYDTGGGVSQGLLFQYVAASNQYYFNALNGSQISYQAPTAISDALPNPTKWRNVVAVYDSSNGNQSIFVDGVCDDSDIVLNFCNVNSQDFVISAYSYVASAGNFNGSLDEIMIFNTALSPSEIRTINSSGRNQGSYAGASAGSLISHWRADDETANDDKGINNGTLYGTGEVVLEANTAYLKLLIDFRLRADNENASIGADDDYQYYFNGSDLINWITSTAKVYWNNAVEYVFGSNVTIEQNLDVVGNITGNQIYGRMSACNNSGDLVPFAAQNTFYNFTMTKNFSNGFHFENGNSLVALVNGSYFVSYRASGSGDANSVYKAGVGINGVVKNCSASFFRTSNSNDVVTMAGSMVIGEIYEGDIITLMIEDTTGTGTGKRYSSQLSLIRMGDADNI